MLEHERAAYDRHLCPCACFAPMIFFGEEADEIVSPEMPVQTGERMVQADGLTLHELSGTPPPCGQEQDDGEDKLENNAGEEEKGSILPVHARIPIFHDELPGEKRSQRGSGEH